MTLIQLILYNFINYILIINLCLLFNFYYSTYFSTKSNLYVIYSLLWVFLFSFFVFNEEEYFFSF